MAEINLQIDSEYQPYIDCEKLQNVVESTLSTCNRTHSELTIVITSDEAVQMLNRQYRGLDVPTDVLSFEAQSDDFVLPLDGPPYLGDIIIAMPTAINQAKAVHHMAAEEVLLLAIHGTLHLLGYDHLTVSDKHRMWQLQAQILQQHNLSHVKPTE